MLEHETLCDLSAEPAVAVPQLGKRMRRLVSYESTRPMKNAQPLSWLFVGAVSMPRSEHLIPFLN